MGKTWFSYSEHTWSDVLGSTTSKPSTSPTELKGVSHVLSIENDDFVSKGSSPSQEETDAATSSFAIGNLKEQGKSESNIQIHPSFTHQIDHGEEGIKHHR